MLRDERGVVQDAINKRIGDGVDSDEVCRQCQEPNGRIEPRV